MTLCTGSQSIKVTFLLKLKTFWFIFYFSSSFQPFHFKLYHLEQYINEYFNRICTMNKDNIIIMKPGKANSTLATTDSGWFHSPARVHQHYLHHQNPHFEEWTLDSVINTNKKSCQDPKQLLSIWKQMSTDGRKAVSLWTNYTSSRWIALQKQ